MISKYFAPALPSHHSPPLTLSRLSLSDKHLHRRAYLEYQHIRKDECWFVLCIKKLNFEVDFPLPIKAYSKDSFHT